ncbi:ComEA family DNA-binding protein [Rickettsiella endosymbiont of Miltochrista miniata]|uniref:ComEA family DNA-binding protein n=1 Tax=Rickettsiella endosymbiont of Miltochrista miniata TaxID=3066239 RepID=UPI00313DE1B2
MDIYSSLFAILLASVIATPVLATTSPFISHNNTVSTASPAKTISNPVSALVNINTADGETLAAELKGIGIKRAKAILAYRNEHGPFKSIDDLIKIKGISKRIVDQNREKITV